MEQILNQYTAEIDALPFWERVGIAAAIVVVAYMVDLIFARAIIPAIKKLTLRTEALWDDILFEETVLRRFSNILPPIILTAALPFALSGMAELFVGRICLAYIIICVCRFVSAIIKAIYQLFAHSGGNRARSLMGIGQTLQIVVWLVGTILVVSALVGRSPLYFITGLGAAATVLMLVFQDSIKGLVAGIQLSYNDMLHTGDWIAMPSRGVDGVVTDITLNTVKVQNWDRTIMTIQPYALLTETFQNWRGMQESEGRRICRGINVDARSIRLTQGGKSTNLTDYREALRQWLMEHPDVNTTMSPVMVRQLAATDRGIPVQIYCFSRIKVWAEYEEIQARMVEHMLALLPDFGLRVYQLEGGMSAGQA